MTTGKPSSLLTDPRTWWLVASLALFLAGFGGANADPATRSPEFGDDSCALAQPLLLELEDAAAIEWIRQAAADPAQELFAEPFRCGFDGGYQDQLWFVRDDSNRAYGVDGAGDFFIRLTGTFNNGMQIPSELQTFDSYSPLAAERIRYWFKFQRTSPGDQANDTTIGIERFDYEIDGGFFNTPPPFPPGEDCSVIPPNTDCYCDCVCNRDPVCNPPPPAVCDGDPPIPESCKGKETHEAHFAVLLDFDEPLQVAVFADGSPCGHLDCSPFTDEFVPQCGKDSTFPNCECDNAGSDCHLTPEWHLLFAEIDPLAPAVRFCLDGEELLTGTTSGVIGELADDLAAATYPVRVRAVANSETPGEDEVLEVDWFVVQGLMAPPIFIDSFESGDACAWSAATAQGEFAG